MRSLPWLQHLIRSWNSLLDYRQNCQEYDTNANLNDVNKQYYLEYCFLVQRIRRLLFLSIFVVPNLFRSSWTHVCFLLRPDLSPFQIWCVPIDCECQHMLKSAQNVLGLFTIYNFHIMSPIVANQMQTLFLSGSLTIREGEGHHQLIGKFPTI